MSVTKPGSSLPVPAADGRGGPVGNRSAGCGSGQSGCQPSVEQVNGRTWPVTGATSDRRQREPAVAPASGGPVRMEESWIRSSGSQHRRRIPSHRTSHSHGMLSWGGRLSVRPAAKLSRPDAEAVSHDTTFDALSRWRHGFESRWGCQPVSDQLRQAAGGHRPHRRSCHHRPLGQMWADVRRLDGLGQQVGHGRPVGLAVGGL